MTQSRSYRQGLGVPRRWRFAAAGALRFQRRRRVGGEELPGGGGFGE